MPGIVMNTITLESSMAGLTPVCIMVDNITVDSIPGQCMAVTMAGSTPAEWPADFMAAGIIEGAHQ